MKDKILEIIKEESEKANVRKYTCINEFGYSPFERNITERVVKLFCQPDVSGSLPSLNEIQLEPIYGSTYCQYSIIEQKLATLYQNQEKILQAIKLLGNDR